MNKQKTKTQTTVWWLPGERGGEGILKGVQYMVMENNLTSGCGHTMQYTDHMSQKRTLESYIILLTTVTPVNLIKKYAENVLTIKRDLI